MDTIIQPSIETNRLASPDLTRRQIRGSSLLLAGRFVSVGINFAAQVLVVRYLSTQNYGAWAYALAVVALGQSFATFGLDRATTRFVPIITSGRSTEGPRHHRPRDRIHPTRRADPYRNLLCLPGSAWAFCQE